MLKEENRRKVTAIVLAAGKGSKMGTRIHKQYLDIQYLCAGEEKYGVAPNVGQDIISEAKEQNDIYFFDSVKEETFITLKRGDYLILFPEDIHRPGLMVAAPMQIKKVVVKVNMDLI